MLAVYSKWHNTANQACHKTVILYLDTKWHKPLNMDRVTEEIGNWTVGCADLGRCII